MRRGFRWSLLAVLIIMIILPAASVPQITGASDDDGGYDGTRAGSRLNDPGLNYSTMVGTDGTESIVDLELGEDGEVYLCGFAGDSAFPMTNGSFVDHGIGAYVMKLNTRNSSIVYSNVFLDYLQLHNNTIIRRLLVDDQGSPVLVGTTEDAAFPTTPGAFCETYSGSVDIFVVKLAPNGTQIVYSTLLGGRGNDRLFDVDIDGEGCVYLVGETEGPTFPTTPGVVRESRCSSHISGFLSKLSVDGTRLEYSTFIGSDRYGSVEAMAVDPTGRVRLTGYADNDLVTTEGAFDDGGGRAGSFVMGLNEDATSVEFATYLKGNDTNRMKDIRVDEAGNVYLTGWVRGGGFPVTDGSVQPRSNVENKMFVTKLNPNGTDLLYSTLVGGSDHDDPVEMHVDEEGGVTVLALTESADLPATPGSFDGTFGGVNDAYLFKVDSLGGVFQYASYFGGSAKDQCTGLSVDEGGLTYFAGATLSPDYPTTANAYIRRHQGSWDGFLTCMGELNPPRIIDDLSDAEMVPGEGYTFRGEVADDSGVSGVTVHYWIGDTSNVLVGDAVMGSGTAKRGVWTFSFTVHFGAEDELGYYIQAQDLYGCLNRSSIRWIRPVDLVGPAIELTSAPRAGTGEIYNLTARVTDEVLVDQVWASYGFGEDPRTNVSMTRTSSTGPDVDWYHLVITVPSDSLDPLFVDVSAVDTSGNWNVGSAEIAVRDTIGPTAAFSLPSKVEVQNANTLDGNDSTDNIGVATFTWTVRSPDGTVDIEGMSVIYRFERTGNHLVILNVTDDAGNWDNETFMVTVVDTTPPEVEAGNDLTSDQGDEVRLDGSWSWDNVGITRWTWSFEASGTTIYLQGEVVTYSFEEAGEYRVTLTVLDDAGNEAVDDLLLVVLDTEEPKPSFWLPETIEVGTDLVLDGSNSTDNVGVVQYEWMIEGTYENKGFQGPVEMTGDRSVYRFEYAGTYHVSLIVTDEVGNSNAGGQHIEVTKAAGSGEDGDGGDGGGYLPYAIVALVLAGIVAALVFLLARRGDE